MFNRIENLQKKLLVGRSAKMSFNDNQTLPLWRGFMPLKKQITSIISPSMYAMQVYATLPDFQNFDPSTIFTKWAAAEVSNHLNIPDGLYPYVLKGGLYAVFTHKGTPEQFQKTFMHIFMHWLPSSAYKLDNREHFELLPENYRTDDPEAIEEVWVPIILK